MRWRVPRARGFVVTSRVVVGSIVLAGPIPFSMTTLPSITHILAWRYAMELFSGFGLVGIILGAWGTMSVAAALVIWATLVASKGLRPAEPHRTAAMERSVTPHCHPCLWTQLPNRDWSQLGSDNVVNR